MNYSYGFYLGQPWWLAGCVLLVPIVWLAWRNLAALGPVRRTLATILRCVVVVILLVLLARPMLTRKSRRLTVVVVLDRSRSISAELQQAALDYLSLALR
jgi:hypothetical protein